MLAIERCHLSIEAVVATPYASGLAVLGDDEAVPRRLARLRLGQRPLQCREAPLQILPLRVERGRIAAQLLGGAPERVGETGAEAQALALPYFWRKRSTRPPMLSTDFCVPV